MTKGIATKHNLSTQGAQNRVTREKATEVNRIAAWKTSSSILELMYSAIAATNRVTNERVSILLFLLIIGLRYIFRYYQTKLRFHLLLLRLAIKFKRSLTLVLRYYNFYFFGQHISITEQSISRFDSDHNLDVVDSKHEL